MSRKSGKGRKFMIGFGVFAVVGLGAAALFPSDASRAAQEEKKASQEERDMQREEEKEEENKEMSNKEYYSLAQTYLSTNIDTTAQIKGSDTKQWDNVGLREVQGIFKTGSIEHTFHIRFAGKDIVLVSIDDEKIISDMDKQIEYMDSLENK